MPRGGAAGTPPTAAAARGALCQFRPRAPPDPFGQPLAPGLPLPPEGTTDTSPHPRVQVFPRAWGRAETRWAPCGRRGRTKGRRPRTATRAAPARNWFGSGGRGGRGARRRRGCGGRPCGAANRQWRPTTDRQGRLGRQLGQDLAADDGEDLGPGEAVTGEQPVGRRPVLECLSAGGQQAGHGRAPQTQQAAQRESLGALGGALRGEGGEAFLPELPERSEDAGRV